MSSCKPAPSRRSALAKFFSACLASLVLLSAGAHAKCATSPVHEEKFVLIGGIEQWITIRGERCDNPVILFLHGGPGNTLNPYAQALYGAWEKDFTLVQWDQRGAGRTFGRNHGLEGPAAQRWTEDDFAAPGQLTIEGMAQDGIEVAQYLAARLGVRKVILFGGSWSSILAVHMAKRRPDLFHAYVGTGQIVNCLDNELATHRKLLQLARAAGDLKTVSALEAMGAPPWENPRNFGIMRRATRVYEAKTTTAPPRAWWTPAPLYATREMEADYTGGEDFSFIQFVGLKGNGMFSTVALEQLGPDFALPVFLLQGAEDLVTVPEIARRYFDAIVAPQKAFILLPAVGHDPNTAMVDAQFKVLVERVRPLAKGESSRP